MAINTTRLATGLGQIFGGANEINTYRGTTVETRISALITQLSTATNDILTGIYDAKTSAKASEAGYMQYLGSLVSALIIAEVNLDRNIPSDDIVSALTEWKRQMRVATDTFHICLSSLVVTTVGAPVGTSYKFNFDDHDGTGARQDLITPDVYLIQTVADADHGGTKWAETMNLQGEQADSDVTTDTYPTGTGISTNIAVHDPAASTGLVTDSGFNNWSTNTPTNWILGPSTLAGTHVFKVADDPRDGSSGFALRLLGDGTVIPKLRQQLSVSANEVLAVHFRAKKILDPGTDWGVILRLVDSTGAALAGPGSYVNSISTITCAAMSADWANAVKSTFILPSVLPANGIVYLEIVFSQFNTPGTAPVSTAEVYVDHVDVQIATQLYSGGPYLDVFSGTTATVLGDAWTASAGITTGVASDYMIRWLDRFLDLKGKGIRLPTTGSPSQADALIS